MIKSSSFYNCIGANYQCYFKRILLFSMLVVCFQMNAQNGETGHSYAYSEIAAHPRILLSKADEGALRQAIAKYPEFKKIDTYIHKVSDELLSEEPLTFHKRGKRLLAVSRKALTRLYYLSYSYRMTSDVKYLRRAEEELNAVSNFKSWNPSHFLDVGEMCMAVAIAYDWLYEDLQESTRENVKRAIVEKAFEPSYVEENAWFLERHSNWNSVCNAGLVFGALAIMEEEKEASIPIIERALVSNQLPLQVYGPDGNYPEGPGYWNYGTSFQVMLIAALESALGSDNGLSKAPGFLESANYMLFAGGPSGKYFNYSDCGEDQTARSSMFWFADKVNDPTLVYQELDLINAGEYTKVVPSDIERILPNALVFGKNIKLNKVKPPSQNSFTGHGMTPVSIVRTQWKAGNGKYLGIKGGSGFDSHSHLDQGTFVYDTGRLRWAMDFGLQSYITLESKGVKIWEKEQDDQRWEVFRYNNFNHNTITINNQLHNVKGKAEIIETYESKKELGAKVDLTSVLNRNNELKTATRKATIVDNAYLKIEDVIETNDKAVDLRWNMVTPASAEVIDEKTIKLSQNGKTMLLKIGSDIPVRAVIRSSEDPSANKMKFKNGNYGTYNLPNPGTLMVGFDTKIAENSKASFTVELVEGKSDLSLKKNIVILDATNPNTASEGDQLFYDVSHVGIDELGTLYALETPDWNTYGKIDIKSMFGKTFKFRVDAKRITSDGMQGSGIDRSADGQLGVRGGENNGIEKNEGYLVSLDLRDFDPSVRFELTKIGFTYLDSTESCTIVNRKIPGRMMVYNGNDRSNVSEVQITSKHKREFLDISSLGISLNGGEDHSEFFSFFNTSETGNFRVSGFEFIVKK